MDYSDSFAKDPEIIDITETSLENEMRFKQLVSAKELKSLGGKTFAASTDRKICWAKRLFDEWKKE